MRGTTLLTRIENKIIPEPNSGCWIWMGSLDVNGYARIFHDGRNCKASRVAYQVFRCEDPGELFVLHKCDVRQCVNPSHLFLGTQDDNMHDCAKKGRICGSPGESNPKAKITEELALEIFECPFETSKIVSLYGITQSTVRRIKNRKLWRSATLKHLSDKMGDIAVE